MAKNNKAKKPTKVYKMKTKHKNKKITIEEDDTVEEVMLSAEASEVQSSKKNSGTNAAKEDSKVSKISKKNKGAVQNIFSKIKEKVLHNDEFEGVQRKVVKAKKKNVKIQNTDVNSKNDDIEKSCNELVHKEQYEENTSTDKVASENCNEISQESKKRKKKNKKITTNNDESEKVEQTVKNSTFFGEEEADVKEEDIDKFCEDLDEKDNEQYENWVKLIESNFRKK